MSRKAEFLKWAMIVSSLSASLAASAGARDSGGGPPLPYSPEETYKYACQITITQKQVATLSDPVTSEGRIQASVVFSKKPGLPRYIDFADLEALKWSDMPAREGTQPLAVKSTGHRVGMRFAKTEQGIQTLLMLDFESEDSTGKTESHAQASAPFEGRMPLEVELSLGKRNLSEGGSGKTDPAYATTKVSATCQRVE